MMKILLLEDDYMYNESITDYLEDRGFEVDCFYDGEEALDALMETSYHLAILDVKVPKINGHEVIKYLKDVGNTTPIIIITSLVDIDSITIGYQLGCNDYLKKPFDLKELELRINQIFEINYHVNDKKIVQLPENYAFDLSKLSLYKENETINLTSKENKLVEFLILNANTYVELESIREHVWENKEIHYADIRMYIRKVRLKTHKDFILSSRGLGYKIETQS